MDVNGILISEDVLRSVPTGIILRYSIIPFDNSVDVVKFFCSDDADQIVIAEEIQFIFEKNILLTPVPASTIASAIQSFGLANDGDLRCSSSKFKFRCPKRWHQLKRLESTDQRHCDVCEQTVYWAETWDDFERLQRERKCVAISDKGDETLGLPVSLDGEP
jgi:hypothetical protein